jgi:hypothetical protein
MFGLDSAHFWQHYTGMEYRDDDRRFFETRIRTPRDHPPVWFLAALLIGWFAAMVFAASTDLEDAVNVAQAEEEVHQQYLDTWIRFRPTVIPFRASDLGVIATTCQQADNRKWECYAK